MTTPARLGRRLTYSNVIATLALFFSLTGASMAGLKYLAASDPIPATSDLAGSIYGNPIIAAGKVTSGKIADGAIGSSKFDTSAVAPDAAKLGGQAADSYLTADAVKRFGPIAVVDPVDFGETLTTIATIGQMTFECHCTDAVAPIGNTHVQVIRMTIESSAAHISLWLTASSPAIAPRTKTST